MPYGYTEVLFERHGHVGVITLNKPERLNAFSETMHREMGAIWHDINADDEVRVTVVTGAGRAFSTGADVKEAAGAMETGELGPARWLRSGDLLTRFLAHETNRYQYRGMPVPSQGLPGKPMIAAINGMCAGGGLHYAIQCDFAIASDDAEFFDPHVNVAIVPTHETLMMMRTIPRTTALAIAFLGLRFRVNAERARQLGLVTEVVTREQLMPRALELATTLAESTDQDAVLATKANFWNTWDLSYEDAKPWSRAYQNQVRFSESRRQPAWRAR